MIVMIFVVNLISIDLLLFLMEKLILLVPLIMNLAIFLMILKKMKNHYLGKKFTPGLWLIYKHLGNMNQLWEIMNLKILTWPLMMVLHYNLMELQIRIL